MDKRTALHDQSQRGLRPDYRQERSLASRHQLDRPAHIRRKPHMLTRPWGHPCQTRSGPHAHGQTYQ